MPEQYIHVIEIQTIRYAMMLPEELKKSIAFFYLDHSCSQNNLQNEYSCYSSFLQIVI